MAWWVWIVSAALVAWSSVQLWRAKTFGKINGGVADFTRSASPIAFWFQVCLSVLVATLFGAAMLIVVARDIGLISN
jgi:hypothetical protein